MKMRTTFCELLQAFFTERLMSQRNASPNTIAIIATPFVCSLPLPIGV